jgi:hypothetical protein
MSLLPKKAKHPGGIDHSIDDDLRHFDVIDMIELMKNPWCSAKEPARGHAIFGAREKSVPGHESDAKGFLEPGIGSCHGVEVSHRKLC